MALHHLEFRKMKEKLAEKAAAASSSGPRGGAAAPSMAPAAEREAPPTFIAIRAMW